MIAILDMLCRDASGCRPDHLNANRALDLLDTYVPAPANAYLSRIDLGKPTNITAPMNPVLMSGLGRLMLVVADRQCYRLALPKTLLAAPPKP